MRIFKTKAFARDAKSEGLSDKALKNAIGEVQKGLVDAELGGNLIKKRIGIGGKGKRGGLRTIIAFKLLTDALFCLYVFSKNDADNISHQQLQELKLLAKTLLNLTDVEIEKALTAGVLKEVI